MLDTITTSTTIPTDADTTDTHTEDETTAPLKERAWALHCRGLHSPAISARLGVSERTIRHWINRIQTDLEAHHRDQHDHHLILAIARNRQIASAAWESYEHALALEEAERTHALTATDEGVATACVRSARHALTAGARYLTLAAAADRELARLQLDYHLQCDEEELQAREQEFQAREEQRRWELEREHLLRQEERMAHERERAREPRPPFGLDPATLAPQRGQTPATRLPEVNAYFAAYDTFHAARKAADTYTAILARAAEDRPTDRDDDYLVQSAFSLRQPQRPPQRQSGQQSASLLARLTPADIAALTARLDAEEAQEAQEAQKTTESGMQQQIIAEEPGEGAKTEIAAKSANPPDTPPDEIEDDEDDDEPDEDGTEYAAITANPPCAHPPAH